MHNIILEMADRLKFDELTIGQLKQVSEYIVELECLAKQSRDRIAELELSVDVANQIIEIQDGCIAHG